MPQYPRCLFGAFFPRHDTKQSLQLHTGEIMRIQEDTLRHCLLLTAIELSTSIDRERRMLKMSVSVIKCQSACAHRWEQSTCGGGTLCIYSGISVLGHLRLGHLAIKFKSGQSQKNSMVNTRTLIPASFANIVSKYNI